MQKKSPTILFFLALCLSGCASIKESAQALGTAGQAAPQALVTQTETAKQTLPHTQQLLMN